jgi:hypothetical protein
MTSHPGYGYFTAHIRTQNRRQVCHCSTLVKISVTSMATEAALVRRRDYSAAPTL